MKYIYLVFILLVANVSAKPSGYCALSSHLCIEKDFLPRDDARNCTTLSDDAKPVNSTYKTCGAFETCYKQADDYDGIIYCHKVSDFNANNPGPIEKACKKWKQAHFCEFNTMMFIWLVIGALVLIGGIGFLIYYFVRKSKDAEAAKKFAQSAVSKAKYQRLKNSRKSLYKFEP